MIFDPKKKHTLSVKSHHMRVDYSAYEGREVTGKVETVLSRGRVIIEAGEYHGKPGDGVYLKRGTSQYRSEQGLSAHCDLWCSVEITARCTPRCGRSTRGGSLARPAARSSLWRA